MTYEFLEKESIPRYIAHNPELAAVVDPKMIADIAEVGDGNLNLVFIVRDAHGGSLVLKQALPYVRLVGPEWPMTPERARREADCLARHGEVAGEFVPKVYLFDHARYVIGMEDLSDHTVWRGALIDGRRHEGAAARMGEYVADVAFGTSVLAVEPEVFRREVADSVNIDLCAITEALVFTEPFVGAYRNTFLPENGDDVASMADDDVMLSEMAHAKWIFTTRSEALIHGDLHTGSVMVRTADGMDGPVSSVKAFDSEFAFYGPVAFDLGALWANYTLAAARAVALEDHERAEWTLSLATETWVRFEERFLELYPSRRDARLTSEAFGRDLLDRWRSETWLFAAAKMARRIVGLAKVQDIETLEAPVRIGAARGILAVARQSVRDRHHDSSPAAFRSMAMRLLRENATR